MASDWNLEQATGARLLDHPPVAIQRPEHTQQQRHIHELIAFSGCHRSVFISHPVIGDVPSSTVFAKLDEGRAWSSKPHQALIARFTHSIDGHAKSSHMTNVMIWAVPDVHSYPFPASTEQLPTQIALPRKDLHEVEPGTLPYVPLPMRIADEELHLLLPWPRSHHGKTFCQHLLPD